MVQERCRRVITWEVHLVVPHERAQHHDDLDPRNVFAYTLGRSRRERDPGLALCVPAVLEPSLRAVFCRSRREVPLVEVENVGADVDLGAFWEEAWQGGRSAGIRVLGGVSRTARRS